MSNTARKSDPEYRKPSRFVTGAMAVLGGLALALATGLLFIHPQFSLMIYGLAGIGMFIGNHVVEQKKWEFRTDTKMTRLQKQQEEMAKKIDLSHYRLELLTNEVAQISVPAAGAPPAPAPRSAPVSDSVAPSAAPTPAAQAALLRKKILSANAVSRSGLRPSPAEMRAMPVGEKRPVVTAKPSASPKPKAPPRKTMSPPVHMVANDRKVPRQGKGKSFHDTLSDIVVKELLHHAVKEKDIAMFVQPIVRLPHGNVKFYEVYGRLRAREGSYIPAARYADFARDEGVMSQIDAQLLMHCLKELIKAQGTMDRPVFFLNIEPRSIKNMAFMNELLSFLAQNRELATQLVLEIPHMFFAQRDQKTARILNGLKALGCSFSLDHVEHLQLDLNDLHRAQVRFVKIPVAMVMHSVRDTHTRNKMVRMKRLLESNGIGVIAEKVENKRMLETLKRFGLHYGQGYLFGRPAQYQAESTPPEQNARKAS